MPFAEHLAEFRRSVSSGERSKRFLAAMKRRRVLWCLGRGTSGVVFRFAENRVHLAAKVILSWDGDERIMHEALLGGWAKKCTPEGTVVSYEGVVCLDAEEGDELVRLLEERLVGGKIYNFPRAEEDALRASLEEAEGGVLVIFSEIAGGDALKYLEGGRVERAREVVFQALCGLRALWAQGIVHGDARLANLMRFERRPRSFLPGDGTTYRCSDERSFAWGDMGLSILEDAEAARAAGLGSHEEWSSVDVVGIHVSRRTDLHVLGVSVIATIASEFPPGTPGAKAIVDFCLELLLYRGRELRPAGDGGLPYRAIAVEYRRRLERASDVDVADVAWSDFSPGLSFISALHYLPRRAVLVADPPADAWWLHPLFSGFRARKRRRPSDE